MIGTFRQFLLEMAVSRSKALTKIEEQALPLREHILNVLCTGEFSNWDKTISNIIETIHQHRESTKKEIPQELAFRIIAQYIRNIDFMKSQTRILRNKGLKIKNNITEAGLLVVTEEMLLLSPEENNRYTIRKILSKELK